MDAKFLEEDDVANANIWGGGCITPSGPIREPYLSERIHRFCSDWFGVFGRFHRAWLALIDADETEW
jgi:hypothetical protein